MTAVVKRFLFYGLVLFWDFSVFSTMCLYEITKRGTARGLERSSKTPCTEQSKHQSVHKVYGMKRGAEEEEGCKAACSNCRQTKAA